AAGDVDQDAPAEMRAGRQVEQHLRIHIDQPRGILDAFEVAPEPVHAFGNTRKHQLTSSLTIHVSLLPPPCDEFTTYEPLTSATRVSPPGVTYVSLPCRMKGRKSTWRGSTLSFVMIG